MFTQVLYTCTYMYLHGQLDSVAFKVLIEIHDAKKSNLEVFS